MADPVLQTVPLGFQWATVDPFLFCVHHLDRYPAGNEHMGPAASLGGTRHGHGLRRRRRLADVPRQRRCPASRSTRTAGSRRSRSCARASSTTPTRSGATARFGRGDVQWLTAGEGIVHCEMFPLLDRDGPNPCELFQIWLNLPGGRQDGRAVLHDVLGRGHPAARRHRRRRPHHRGHGDRRDARRACGRRRRRPSSWASRAEADLAIWHVVARAAARAGRCRPPPVPTPCAPCTCSKGRCTSAITTSKRRPASVLRTDEAVGIAGGPYGAEALVLQGRPIGEPVAQYGPFVMNDQAGIEQAFADYRAHRVRRLAVADRRSGARARRRPVRPPRRRAGRAALPGQRLTVVSTASPGAACPAAPARAAPSPQCGRGARGRWPP